MLCTLHPTVVDVDVECYKDDGETYTGSVGMTREGLVCRAWDKGGDYTYLGSHNHCRNPGPPDTPWCFTADDVNTIWGYCNIKKCHGSPRAIQTEDQNPSKKHPRRRPKPTIPKNSNGRDKGRDVPPVYSMVIAPLRKRRNKFMT